MTVTPLMAIDNSTPYAAFDVVAVSTLMPEASPMNSRRSISLPPNKGTVS
jgi:hypothetical protein